MGPAMRSPKPPCNQPLERISFYFGGNGVGVGLSEFREEEAMATKGLRGSSEPGAGPRS